MSEKKAIIIPYSPGNPYQKQLIDELKISGISVFPAGICRFFPVLVPVKKNWKPDILHLHWLHRFMMGRNRLKTVLKSAFFILEIIILKILGIKVIWTVHNLHNHERLYEKVEYFFTKIFIKFCDSLIVHTHAAREIVLRAFRLKGKGKIEVISHGNYNEYYENRISRIEARSVLKTDEKKFVFLSFGKIRKYKGNIQLIKVFKTFNNSDFELLIAGDPYDRDIRDEIIKAVKGSSNIKLFARFIKEEEVQIFMNAADVVVLPYEDILTSGAAILAMSFRKPVVAPSFESIKEVLDENNNFLYDFLNPAGLRGAMSEAYSQKNNLKKIGENNFNAVKNITWEKVAARTAALYFKQNS